jgi:hypothetical protein
LKKLKWLMMPFLILLCLLLTGMPGLGQEMSETDTQKAVDRGATQEYLKQPDWMVQASPDVFYGISRQAGFLFSGDAGVIWEPRNEGLPKKRIYPFKEEKVRNLTELGVDQGNPARVAVITANGLYLSEDYGKTWTSISRKRPIPEGAYLTAVALSPLNQNTILLGTSFAGIFETTDRGRTWTNISRELRFLCQGADYWQEIAALAYQRSDPERIIFKCGFEAGIYRLAKNRKQAEKITLPDYITSQTVEKLQDTVIPNSNRIENQSNDTQNPKPEEQVDPKLVADITNQLYHKDLSNPNRMEDPVKAARLDTAAKRYGIYLRSDKASGKSLAQMIRMIKKNSLNAMVIDFKDDFGIITYDTKLALPRRMGAVRRNPIHIKELLNKAKENGIYVIGRIVTFQDPQLYRYQNYKYAVWDQTRNKPWSTREYWVDPFAQDVWEYNRAIAEELQSLGVDEIQFDYIRFPTDGDISRISFRYRPAGAEKIDALESFLGFARERITIPISTDLYGFSCWCRSLSVNGQNLDVIADYVDVICPMYYPSHFPSGFLPGMDYLERAYKIYDDGTSRALAIVQGRSIVRPYVQAFRLGKERRMTQPVDAQYLIKQIQGNLATASPGFTLWDYSNSYYMLTEPLGGLLERNHVGEN